MKLCCIKCGSYEINHSASDGCDSQLKYLCGVCHWKTLAEIRLAYVGQLERNVNELKDQIMNNQLCDTNLKVSQERDDLHVRVKRLEDVLQTAWFLMANVNWKSKKDPDMYKDFVNWRDNDFLPVMRWQKRKDTKAKEANP